MTIETKTLVGLFLIPLVFGLVGAISPCVLGINAVFLGYVAGKPRPTPAPKRWC